MSLVVHVFDALTGDDVCEGTLSVRNRGMLTERELTCERETNTYGFGAEQDGTFEIGVAAPGYNPTTARVDIEKDECHVQTQQVVLELERSGN